MPEFLHVDDLAGAVLLEHYDAAETINVGSGTDLSIKDLADLVKNVVGYDGDIAWDSTQPDGTPRKLLDVSRLTTLGWQATTPLRDGVESTYAWFREHVDTDARV